jgi:hypothetical protein
MTSTQSTLLQKVQKFELDDPQAALTFSQRLARENGWDLKFALRAIDEYKRFMFLICIAPHPLTPSDEVDQVWHLHLLYTRSYWDDFCRCVLEREIHHGPTKGGKQEKEKFTDWYDKTKQLYSETFGHAPPQDLWPDADQRFNDIHFQRINLRKHFVFHKPAFLQSKRHK